MDFTVDDVLAAPVPDKGAPEVGWRCWFVKRRDEYLGASVAEVVDADFAAGGKATLHTVHFTPAYSLVSLGLTTWWPKREELRAKCSERGDHFPPAPDCSCGIYAFRDSAAADLDAFMVGFDRPGWEIVHRVIGQVSLWGHVIPGAKGWRAEYAYPHRLFVPARRRVGREWLEPPVGVEEIALGLGGYGVPVEIVASPDELGRGRAA